MIKNSPLDIFRVELDGVRWIESASTLEDATARIHQFAVRNSGEYIVLNQLTGAKFAVNTVRAVTESEMASRQR